MQTPSQTVGPFFAFGLFAHPDQHILVNDQTRGECILITGLVLDGDGAPVPDAMIELWQADSNGHFNHPADPDHTKSDPHFSGFGRSATPDGKFLFRTIKPGSVPFDGEHRQAPHLNLRVFARGMLIHAYTRLYFSDELAANAADPVLNLIPAERRGTLIAERQAGNDLPTYCLNIHLQGENETVFFDP
jgi:protocatechuate 3,4-dioxygenase alpha subunit